MLFVTFKHHQSDFQLKVNDKFACIKLALNDSLLGTVRVFHTVRVRYIPYAYGMYCTRMVCFPVPYAYGCTVHV